MVAVAISLEGNRTSIMPNKRIPLANNPNAVNSPYRPLAAATAIKRSRHEAEKQDGLTSDQQPPSKRQAIEILETRPRTPTRRQPLQHPEGRVSKKTTSSQVTSFERNLFAEKDKQTQQRVERQEQTAADSLNGIKQWQRHYRKVFPEFVFYFEHVPAEAQLKYSKQIRALGARELKFFSKEVTHVVTTRALPALPAGNNPFSPTDNATLSLATANSQATSQLRVTNGRSVDHGQLPLTRSKLVIESSLSKKTALSGFRDVEPRRLGIVQNDFLWRVKEMGMKIWQLEKLQRVTNTMFVTPDEAQAQTGRHARTTVNQANPDVQKEADLSRMLRNEMLNGPSDRDSSMNLVELMPFKGPYIYIRDMDEKTKPIMVKEYPKAKPSEKGDWPQFRCVSGGKCPFIEEADPGKWDSDRAKARDEHAAIKAQARSAPKTRAKTALEKSQGRSVENLVESLPNIGQKQPLGELRWGGNKTIPVIEKKTDGVFCAPPPTTKRGRSPLKGSKNAATNAGPRLFCGEPLASGLQPSNVTSAIRSQLISSTAAGPGAKAGTSREFQELKRKVLERNNGSVPHNLQTSRKIHETLTVARAGNSNILINNKSKTHEIVDLCHEDVVVSPTAEEDLSCKADEGNVRVGGKINSTSTKSTEGKEQKKPGYCENCRDKYDDFDVHIIERRHRKFALTSNHWKDLDQLLEKLQRPLKADEWDDF